MASGFGRLQANKRLFPALLVLFCLAVLGLTGSPASAHRVMVFAWAEGGMVHTESKFSGGRKAKNASIEVYDTGGTKLLEGKTDEKGCFSFPIPKISELRVVLRAGAGHKNSWTIPEAEILSAAGVAESAAGSGEPAPQAGRSSSEKPAKAGEDPGGEKPRATAGNTTALQREIAKTVARKLTPVTAKLDRLQSRVERNRLSDILGAIGYIVGLVGLATYLRFRKKGRNPNDR